MPFTFNASYHYLVYALKKQRKNLNDQLRGFKEKFEINGVKYEVRIHDADTRYGKTGTIFRVMRNKSGTLGSGQQGLGKEYMDENGIWHYQRYLKTPRNSIDEQAIANTHIQLNL